MTTNPTPPALLRDQLLHAIDFAYTTGVLGYGTPEELLAAYDASRTPSAADRGATAPAAWIDGHPQLEAIAAAVWEQCGRSDSGMCVEDDPRNIAVAALAALRRTATAEPPTDRGALRDRIAEVLRTTPSMLGAQNPQLGFPSHHQPGEAGYLGWCALCVRDIDALADALADAVLPPPADQAAVLRWAVDRIDAAFTGPGLDRYTRYGANLLRRMADETPTAETQQDEAGHVCNSVWARGEMDEPLGYLICGLCGKPKGGAQR